MSEGVRVLVCGGRAYRDFECVTETLDAIDREEGPIGLIIAGGAPGADSDAEAWADLWKVKTAIYPANWTLHGRAAGPIRNARMIDHGKPDLVVAFPGGRGTDDMVRRAEAAGIRVKRITGRASLEKDGER